jgi:hypothetical protein
MPTRIHSAMCVLACRISGMMTVLFGGMFVGYAISRVTASGFEGAFTSSLVFSVAIGGVMGIAGATLISPSGTRRVARLVRDGNIYSQLAHLPLAIGAIATVLAACVIYYQSRGQLSGVDGVLFGALVVIGVYFTYCFFSLPRFLSSLRLEGHFEDQFEPAPVEVEPSEKPEKLKFSRAV